MFTKTVHHTIFEEVYLFVIPRICYARLIYRSDHDFSVKWKQEENTFKKVIQLLHDRVPGKLDIVKAP